MGLEKKEKIDSIINRLDSIAEILYVLQMLDNDENEEFSVIKISSFLELPIFEIEKIKNELEDIIR